jgi:hypothetical protein
MIMTISERALERKFVSAVHAEGGVAPKLVCPGFDGMPDRLVLLPNGRVSFVEVKAPGEKLRPIQESRRRLLQRLGFRVFVLDGEEQIPAILKET